ncbi:PepSY domain-containing protein [Intestinibacter sp.]|uniref:PepSY domain-containing protein n=1 Tax=Intestinibacter sp. TaxID=1965304 RepID=UPI002A7572EA|nr:PepSY domain-containing protein [Intestinibacter sp.]MDY2734538.1 PepSY domain-containing protein [Intestinibacter sp.]
MKIKRNIAIGLGAIMIAGISIVGVSQISANAQNKAATNTTTQQQATITEAEAKELIAKKVPGAEIIKFKLEKDDGILQYDATLVKDNMEYDIDVDANTGKILSLEKEVYDEEDKLEDQTISKESNKDENTTEAKENYISREEAKKIMKNKASGATLVDFEFDMDDGRAEYEGELVGNNIEYDIVLDATTGAVIEFEKDYDDDRYDDDRDYDDDDYDDDRYDDDDYDDDRYDDDDDDDRDDD